MEVVATWPLLGYSHVRALLPAPPEEHERLVAETLENDWTVDELQKEVEKLHPRRRGGRRPASPVVKAAAAAVAGAASLEAALRGRKPLDEIEARQVFDAVKRILGIMRKMHERLAG